MHLNKFNVMENTFDLVSHFQRIGAKTELGSTVGVQQEFTTTLESNFQRKLKRWRVKLNWKVILKIM